MTLEEIKNKYLDVTEEKLLENIEKYKSYMRWTTLDRVKNYNKDLPDSEAIINEWNKIQEKKSYLSSSERNEIAVFVGMCIVDIINKD